MYNLVLSVVIFVLTTDAQSYNIKHQQRYISNARVEQIVKQERARCRRCTEKELIGRINARIARE